MPTARNLSPAVLAWIASQHPDAASPSKPRARRARPALVAGAFDPPGTWTVPLHLERATNGSQVDRSMVGRAAKHRRAVARAFAPTLAHLAAFVGGPVRCTITRLGTREMDDDNLPPAAKWVRDTVCLFLGCGDGPRDPVIWKYDQCPAGPAGVRIQLERMV